MKIKPQKKNTKGQVVFPSANPGGGYSSSHKKIKPDKRVFQRVFPKYKLSN